MFEVTNESVCNWKASMIAVHSVLLALFHKDVWFWLWPLEGFWGVFRNCWWAVTGTGSQAGSPSILTSLKENQFSVFLVKMTKCLNAMFMTWIFIYYLVTIGRVSQKPMLVLSNNNNSSNFWMFSDTVLYIFQRLSYLYFSEQANKILAINSATFIINN